MTEDEWGEFYKALSERLSPADRDRGGRKAEHPRCSL